MIYQKFQKWTPSSMIKFHDMVWSQFLSDMLKNEKFTREEKNNKIDGFLEWIKMVHDLCLSGTLEYKK